MSEHQGINNALFQFCMRANDGPSAAAEAEARPRASKEDLEWLMNVIKSIDPPEKLMQKSLEALRQSALSSSSSSNSNAGEHDRQESAGEGGGAVGKGESLSAEDRLVVLERVCDMVEDINFANDFLVYGGPALMMVMLKQRPEVAEERRLIAMTIANSAQHNPKLQQAFLDLKYADHVVPLLREESNAAVRAALLFICSCMSRECDHGSAAFITSKGLDALLHILLTHPDEIKTVNRALFLLEYFASIGIAAVGLIETVAQLLLTHENADVKERAASVCVTLLKRSAKEVKPILQKVLGVEKNPTALRVQLGASEAASKLAELLV